VDKCPCVDKYPCVDKCPCVMPLDKEICKKAVKSSEVHNFAVSVLQCDSLTLPPIVLPGDNHVPSHLIVVSDGFLCESDLQIRKFCLLICKVRAIN
jgi:hypothetical protein